MEQEDKLDKRKVKMVEEMYIERDWTHGRYFDEALEGIMMEQFLLENKINYYKYE